jgi:hypothetical protein
VAAAAKKDVEAKQRSVAPTEVAAYADSTALRDAIARAPARAPALDRFDSTRHARPQVQNEAVTAVVTGVAPTAAPSAARAFATAQRRTNYAGCYSVAATGDSLSAFPKLLSLDADTVQGRRYAYIQSPAPSLFVVSALTDAGRRPIDTASWQPLLDGVRLSFGRTPLNLRAAADSTLSTAGVAGRGQTVTMRRVDCPRR